MRDSELILNPDGSIYHLALKPGELASSIITVGDPDRVEQVSRYFDQIEIRKTNREFVAHTGRLNGKNITCLSTGMGSDNIDIVMNELDALVNINFESRQHNAKQHPLTIVRVGTSGSISKEIDIDDILVSKIAIGLEGLMLWYEQLIQTGEELQWQLAMEAMDLPIRPFVCEAEPELLELFELTFSKGITLTTAGFYAPQSRNLRLKSEFVNTLEQLSEIHINGFGITNIEMETAAIYGLAKALGHKAISVNAILANRLDGRFSNNPTKTVTKAIENTLELLCGS